MNGFYNTTYTYHVTTNGVVIPLRMNGFYNLTQSPFSAGIELSYRSE